MIHKNFLKEIFLNWGVVKVPGMVIVGEIAIIIFIFCALFFLSDKEHPIFKTITYISGLIFSSILAIYLAIFMIFIFDFIIN